MSLVLQPLRDDRYRPLLVIPAKAGIHRFKPDCYCQNNMETVLGMYMSNGITRLRSSGWIRLHWNGAGGCGERIFVGCAG